MLLNCQIVIWSAFYQLFHTKYVFRNLGTLTIYRLWKYSPVMCNFEINDKRGFWFVYLFARLKVKS